MAELTPVPLQDLTAATVPLSAGDLLLVSQGGVAKKVDVADALLISPVSANVVFAGPTSGGSAAPSFRALVAADIPGTLNSTTISGTLNATSVVQQGGNAVLAYAQQGTITAYGSLTIGSGLTLAAGGTLTAAGGGGGISTIVAAGVLSGGTITASGTIGLAVGAGLVDAGGGTIANAGVLSVDSATGAILLGSGLTRSSQTVSVSAATTAALGGVIVGTNLSISSGTLNAETASFVTSSTTTPFTLSPGTITSGGTLTLGIAGGTATAVLYFANSTSLAVSGALTGNSVMLGGSTGPKTVGGIVTDGASILTLGSTSTANGHLRLRGSTSGTIDISVQTAAGSYNFNMPITAGSAGDVLTSQGGGATAMTWTTPTTGTLTQIIADGALSGGTITSSGTIGLAVSTGLTIASAGTIAVTNATTAALGGVIVGTNLAVSSGTISLAPAITITDSTAKIVLDRNTGGTLDTIGTVYMQVVGSDGGAVRDVIDTFGAVGQFVTRRADGTRASKTAIQNGDTLGTFGAVGYDGTNYSTGSIASATPQTGMSAVANQNWSSSARGVNLVFFGIANAGTTIANFGTMASTGLVLAGGTLSTAGNAMVLGGNFSTAGALTFAGAFPVTITSTGTTSVTLPTSGTLGVGSITQIIANGALSGGTITSTGTVGLAVSTGLTISAAGTIAVTNATTAALGGVIVGTGLAVSSGTVSVSNTIVVGLSNSIADTITAGTYDLGPFINGGTILNSYAHVVSGTIAFGVAIGQPGTYTDVTGLTAITSTSTTIDTIGTATAANVISAGAHAWLKVTTGAVGGDVFITVKVP